MAYPNENVLQNLWNKWPPHPVLIWHFVFPLHHSGNRKTCYMTLFISHLIRTICARTRKTVFTVGISQTVYSRLIDLTAPTHVTRAAWGRDGGYKRRPKMNPESLAHPL